MPLEVHVPCHETFDFIWVANLQWVMKKIALLSSHMVQGFFEPDNPHAPAHQLDARGGSVGDLSHVSLDYTLLTKTLKNQDIHYELVPWNAKGIDWATFDAVLIHSPWDYYEHKADFLKVLQHIQTQTVLMNSFDTICWNSDKKYLQDLKQAGIPVIDSIFIDTANTPDILTMIPQQGWDNGYVFKPAVSAAAMDVFLVNTPHQAQHIYADHYIGKHDTLIVQPFIKEIREEGEWSFIFFAGKYSHGVLKKTLNDGFLVKHSSENQKNKPSDAMITQAEMLYQDLENLRHDSPLYTRIDIVKCEDKLYVMEVEEIEPYLYLHAKADAASELVAALLSRI